MAKSKGILASIVQAQKQAAAEQARQQKAAARAHATAVRELEKAKKAELRAAAQADKAAAADRKRLEKEAKDAHVAAMQAEVAERNAALAETYGELEGILEATLGVDDFVDLESLKQSAEHPAFARQDLENPAPPPTPIADPPEPTFVTPEPAKGVFGRKKKAEEAVALAKQTFEQDVASWDVAVAEAAAQRARSAEAYANAEAQRVAELNQARAAYAEECRARETETANANAEIDQLIANLGYGTADAIEEYLSIIAANSSYPDHFPVEYGFEFVSSTAELQMSVLVPPPSSIASVKAYKYTKSSDEITSTALSQKASKDRYNGAVHQVALRTIHEVFESDRRGLIKTISLQVGTEEISPATGHVTPVTFLAVAAERDSFMRIQLGEVVPAATLEHLGSAVSKNPHGLVGIKPEGIRKT